MEKVRVGIIGFGCRAYGMTELLLSFDDVEIVAICDKYEDRCENGRKLAQDKRGFNPFTTTNYKEVLSMDNVDAVYIAADWEMHFPIAIDEKKKKKAVALEVGGAYCVQDCYDLVSAWEETKAPFD